MFSPGLCGFSLDTLAFSPKLPVGMRVMLFLSACGPVILTTYPGP